MSKKILCLLLCGFIIFCFTGCSYIQEQDNNRHDVEQNVNADVAMKNIEGKLAEAIELYNKIEIGMNQEEIINLIGEPVNQIGSTLKYDALTFGVEENKCCSKYLDLNSYDYDNYSISKDLNTNIKDLNTLVSKIQEGMKLSEVENILGKQYYESSCYYSLKTYTWYDKNELRLDIDFNENDRVDTINELEQDHIEVFDFDSKGLLKEVVDIYDKVDIGMTRSEIVNILGEPDSDSGYGQNEGMGFLYYHDMDVTFTLIEAKCIKKEIRLDSYYDGRFIMADALGSNIKDLNDYLNDIEIDMTLAEVESILGKEYFESCKTEELKKYTWYDLNGYRLDISFNSNNEISDISEMYKD